MLKLLGVVEEAGLVDSAAKESGGPLVAGEGGGTRETDKVQHVLVHAEGAAVVEVERADEDGASQVPETGVLLNV